MSCEIIVFGIAVTSARDIHFVCSCIDGLYNYGFKDISLQWPCDFQDEVNIYIESNRDEKAKLKLAETKVTKDFPDFTNTSSSKKDFTLFNKSVDACRSDTSMQTFYDMLDHAAEKRMNVHCVDQPESVQNDLLVRLESIRGQLPRGRARESWT